MIWDDEGSAGKAKTIEVDILPRAGETIKVAGGTLKVLHVLGTPRNGEYVAIVVVTEPDT